MLPFMDTSWLIESFLQERSSPVIVGDRYELAETSISGFIGESISGLLAKSTYDAALLPMSSYNKAFDLNSKSQHSWWISYTALRKNHNTVSV